MPPESAHNFIIPICLTLLTLTGLSLGTVVGYYLLNTPGEERPNSLSSDPESYTGGDEEID